MFLIVVEGRPAQGKSDDELIGKESIWSHATVSAKAKVRLDVSEGLEMMNAIPNKPAAVPGGESAAPAIRHVRSLAGLSTCRRERGRSDSGPSRSSS